MAQKTYKVKARLGRVIETGHSFYGNPHHKIVIIKEDDDVIYGKTAVNGGIGYGIRNYGEGKNAEFVEWEYHITKSGNVIFDFVRKIEG